MTATRPGKKWEAIGTILVIIGVIAMVATGGAEKENVGATAMFAVISFLVGLVVFIIGRFK